MNEWLSVIIGLLVAGCSVFFFSSFITYIFKEKFTAKWRYWNMKLSLFFFLFPIFLIPSLFLGTVKENQSIPATSISILHQNIVSITETSIHILFIVWIIGVLIVSLWFLFLYQRFQKKLKESITPIVKENTIQYLLYKNMEDMNIKAPIEIVFSQINMSPILIGTFKPKIVLPMYEIPHDELDMIIRHELTHFKKRDLWIKKAMLLVMIIHWYNPSTYLLRNEINKWSEFSCDEDVVKKMSRTERKKYGEVILNMIHRANQDTTPYFLGSFFATAQTNLKRRLMKILEVKKLSKSVIVLFVAILFGLGSVGTVNANFVHGKIQTMSEKLLPELDRGDIPIDNMAQEEEANYREVTSVKRSDESKFTKEDWEEILEQVENNEIILEDE